MTRSLTSDALAALTSAGLSRRVFVKGSGALIVAFGAARLAGDLGIVPERAAAQGAAGPSGTALDSWIAINADGSVTAYTGKCELGTGLFTAQTQLVAEELSVPIDRVQLIQCDTSITPNQGTTSGAQSHPTNFNHSNLALAGATAREALMQLGAERLGTPVERVTTRDGTVVLRDDAASRVSYGDLIGGRTFDVPLNPDATRKPASEWTVLGQPVPRLDIPAMATGQFEYVHNVRVPNMLHGRVVRPPTFGATVRTVNEQSVLDMPGVVQVVVRESFIGVVAEKPWQAIQAARQLDVAWNDGTRLPDQRAFHEQLRSHTNTRDALPVDSGDVDATLAGASRVIEATYLYPYQMHASIGTACAVADVRDDDVTVWSATQNVYALRSSVALLLERDPEAVHVMFRLGPGCFGINGSDTVSFDAALMSRAVGRPVRVQLSRQDEMAWDNYGLAYVIDQRVGLDANGAIAAWDQETWSVARGGRPGSQRPGNVVTGSLAGFESNLPAPRAAALPTRGYANRANAVPSYVSGCVGGMCGGTGTVTSERMLAHVAESPFFTGPLRSPNRLQHTFAHESFLDEIAASVGADPVQYRLRHLSDPRLREVLTTAAATAGWDTRPSPRARSEPGVATGRGVSCVLYEGDNGYCSVVAEVEVNQDTGVVVVRRFVTAIDCGPISNPNGLRNQVEGGIIQAMSRALREEVTWSEDRVTSVDWRTYKPWYLGDHVPVIESVLINRPDAEASGAGETSITVTAAAIGNAIFDATGARVRQVPFTPERVRVALDARTAG